MNSISLKEASARWGVSERRISQLANETGSGVWRVERGRYSFDPPQKGNHTIEAAEAALYQAGWLAEKGEFKEAKKIMRTAKKLDCEIILPVDVAVANDFKKGEDYKLYNIDKVPNDGLILDIGKKTIRIIEKSLSNCSDVVWCGPLGLFEYRPFDIGTASIARYISNLTNSWTILETDTNGMSCATIGGKDSKTIIK